MPPIHKVLPRGTHRGPRRAMLDGVSQSSRADADAASATGLTRRSSSREEFAGDDVFSIVAQIKRFRQPMSVDDLAPILGVSRNVLYRMVRDADIPQLIVPGRRVTRFDPATIVFWLSKHNPILNQVQKAS